jgi:hypothetical protein
MEDSSEASLPAIKLSTTELSTTELPTTSLSLFMVFPD